MRPDKNESLTQKTGKTTYICFPARKGGVGKTTLVGNVAAFLANDGHRVLLVGTDSQEDISEKYLAPLEDYDIDEHVSFSDVLMRDIDIESSIMTTPEYPQYQISVSKLLSKKIKRKSTGKFYTFDIISAGSDIDSYSSEGLFDIKNHLRKIEQNYDYILFDTPPSESEAVMLSLMASDYALIPVTDRASFKSVKMTLNDLDLVRENGGNVRLLGVVINNQHGARKLDKYNENLFRESLGAEIFETIIRSTSSIPNADAFSVPLCSFEQVTQGYEDFYLFYEEFKQKLKSMEGE